MFIWQALRSIGTPSSSKRRKVSGVAGGATQGAESREAPQPALVAQGAQPRLLRQEAGNDGCTPDEAEQRPLYAASPSPGGGTPSYMFKQFKQPKGRSFLDRNTTKVGWSTGAERRPEKTSAHCPAACQTCRPLASRSSPSARRPRPRPQPCLFPRTPISRGASG